MSVTIADVNNVVNVTAISGNTAAGVGDLIFVSTQGSDSATPSLADQLGNLYKLITFSGNEDGSEYGSLFYSVVTQAGTPTVSASNVSGNGRLNYLRYTGFLMGAIVPSSDFGFSSPSVASASTSASFMASHNSEYAAAFLWDRGQSFTNTSSFSFEAGDNYLVSYSYLAGVSLGTEVTISGTLSAATYWIAMVQGFYDGSPPVPTSYYLSSQSFY